MEKMQGDMLEMILNSPESRLSERKTKFLIFQVVIFLYVPQTYDVHYVAIRYWLLFITSTLRILYIVT